MVPSELGVRIVKCVKEGSPVPLLISELVEVIGREEPAMEVVVAETRIGQCICDRALMNMSRETSWENINNGCSRKDFGTLDSSADPVSDGEASCSASRAHGSCCINGIRRSVPWTVLKIQLGSTMAVHRRLRTELTTFACAGSKRSDIEGLPYPHSSERI